MIFPALISKEFINLEWINWKNPSENSTDVTFSKKSDKSMYLSYLHWYIIVIFFSKLNIRIRSLNEFFLCAGID